MKSQSKYKTFLSQKCIHKYRLQMSAILPRLHSVMVLSSHAKLAAMLNKLRPRQNGRHFADDSFKCIFLHETVWISSNISLKFVPNGQINNIPSLVQIMAWRRPGDKPLSEPMMRHSASMSYTAILATYQLSSSSHLVTISLKIFVAPFRFQGNVSLFDSCD